MLSGLSGLSGLSAVCGGAALDPATLPGYVDSPYSFRALRSGGRLWQDTAETLAATAATNPIRRAKPAASNYDAPSDASRPLLTQSGAAWGAQFDGADDGLVGPSVAGFVGNAPLTFAAAVRVLSFPASFSIIVGGNDSAGMGHALPLIGLLPGGVVMGEWGSGAGRITASGFSAPCDLRIIYRYDGSYSRLRVNGVDIAPVAYSSANGVGGPSQVGRLGNFGVGYFHGIIYSLPLYTGSLSDTDTGRLDAYLAGELP